MSDRFALCDEHGNSDCPICYPEDLPEVKNNYDELRQRHKPSHFFEALCMVEHEPWPCSTVKLLDENAALKRDVETERDLFLRAEARVVALKAENAALRAALEEHQFCQWSPVWGVYCQSCDTTPGVEHKVTCRWKNALGDAS